MFFRARRTPNTLSSGGHADWGDRVLCMLRSYEVSRSLAACEGCLLVVDASQGVEAQTLANVYLALENDLAIIPVLNKIDLPGADVERVKREIEEIIGLDCSNALVCSAKRVRPRRRRRMHQRAVLDVSKIMGCRVFGFDLENLSLRRTSSPSILKAQLYKFCYRYE